MNSLRNPGTGKYVHSLVAAVCIAVVVLLTACGGTSPNGDVKNNWEIYGTITHNGSTGIVSVYVEIYRDGEAFVLGAVKLDDLNVNPIGDGTYVGNFALADLDSLKSSVELDITTSIDDFHFQQLVDVPDAFEFEANGLTDDQVFSNTMVNLEWTSAFSGSADAGYMLLAKQTSGSMTAVGYQETLGGLEGTIPTDAFRNSAGDFQAGNYNLWVVARSQQPIYHNGLPIQFDDSVFSENIDRVGVTGQIGALYIPAPLQVTAVATIAP